MEPLSQVVLADVEELKFEFLDGNGEWQENWQIKALPKAVAVTLKQMDAEPIRRVFLVPGLGKELPKPVNDGTNQSQPNGRGTP